ncbi:MAG TPA: sulfatase [Gemmatimonadales bacterium]|jgi:arylsulfatase A-like enzyme
MTRREVLEGGVLVPLSAAMAGAIFTVFWYLVVRFFLHRLVFTGLDVLWLSPSSYILLEMIPGVPLLLLALLFPRPLVWRLTVFVCAWLTFFSLGLLFRQFWPLATAVLAAGISLRITAMMGPEPGPVLPMLRRFSLWALVLPLGGLVIARGLPLAIERWQDWRLAAAPAAAPNVLLIIVDTERAENLGLYGYAKATSPRLDSIAHSAAVFDWAIAPAPWTLASHASMFSGLPASQTSVRWLHPFNDDVPRISGVLRQHGYATAGFAANVAYTGPLSGLARGFTRYLRRPLTPQRIIRGTTLWQTPLGVWVWQATQHAVEKILGHSRPTLPARLGSPYVFGPARTASPPPAAARRMLRALSTPDLVRNVFPEGQYRPAEEISRNFLAWQKTVTGHPYFAFLNFIDVHEFHRPGRYPAELNIVPSNRAGYDEAMAYDDSVIGATLDTLARRGVLDRTVVIVAADHGEQFLEHGLTGHSNSLYLQLLHVPLLIRYPATVPQGVRIGTAVSTRDLAATIVDLTGLTDRRLPGVSIAETWRHPEVPRLPALSEVQRDTTPNANAPSATGAMRSLVDQTWHYIRGPLRESLYRYREDPREERDLAADTANAAVLDSMRARLRRIPFGY